MLVGSHPYLRYIPSRNSDSFRLKLYLLSGKSVNQFESPFSEAHLSAYFSLSLKLFKMLVLFWFVLSVLSVLDFSCSHIAVNGSYVSRTEDVSIDYSKNFS